MPLEGITCYSFHSKRSFAFGPNSLGNSLVDRSAVSSGFNYILSAVSRYVTVHALQSTAH